MKKRFFIPVKSTGQTAVEYLLVFTVVAIVVLVAFNQFFPTLNQSSNDYFDTITTIIRDDREVAPIDGDWCSWGSCGPDGYQRRECACPQPAFGGKHCSDLTNTKVSDNDNGGSFKGEVLVKGIRECAVTNEPSCPSNQVYNPLKNSCVFCGNGVVDDGENCANCALDVKCTGQTSHCTDKGQCVAEVES